MATPPRILPCKLVLLGDSAVGKSSLVLRFVQDKFSDFHNVTIGAAFLTQTVPVDGGDTVVKYEIWDTAGQERFQSLAPMYYRGAGAAIVVYSVTDADTFERAKQWVRELQLQGNPSLIIALAGNKVDLADKFRAVDQETVARYAADNGFLFFETSAKYNTNVTEMFTDIGTPGPVQHATTLGSRCV